MKSVGIVSTASTFRRLLRHFGGDRLQDFYQSQLSASGRPSSIFLSHPNSSQQVRLVPEMSATRTSAASSGTTTALTMSSVPIIAQTTKIYNLLLIFFIFMIIVVCSVSACFCIWLKKRKTNKTSTTDGPQSENAIPLATLNNALPSSPEPHIPTRHPQRSIMTPPPAPSRTQTQSTQSKQTRPTQSQRSQTTLPPMPLNQRPKLRHNQTYGSDYSSGRPRRYGDDHLAQSGPSVSANVHGNSALENYGSRKMDKINNS